MRQSCIKNSRKRSIIIKISFTDVTRSDYGEFKNLKRTRARLTAMTYMDCTRRLGTVGRVEIEFIGE